MAMAFAAHALRLPLWLSLTVALALLWRLAPFWRREAATQRAVKWLLTMASIAGIIFEHGTPFGAEGGVSLVVLTAAMKVLESKGRRDHGVVVLIGYFLILAALIHHQGPGMAVWLMATALALTASQIVAQGQRVPALGPVLKQGGLIILQSLPLAILLFLLFPRLPALMGGLIPVSSASTGLSDSMRPGSISQLIRSDEIAFRVDFVPPRRDGNRLYWRGPVLWRYDGDLWQREEQAGDAVDAQWLGPAMDYTVTLEPHQQHWLPVTGLAARLSLATADGTADLEWMRAQPVRERLRYSVHAWLKYRLETVLSPQRRARALVLPPGYNPRTLALARHWAALEPTPEGRVRRALALFREQPFHYTLSPPRLGKQAIDEFLFDSRRGFCEHYAAAFVVLIRAAGVPARVITGYQGGEMNPLGDYWIVRQRDAHAWAEVWLPGQGWVQVDPTAAVAPSRVEVGLAAALPAAERPLIGLDTAWLKPTRQLIDLVGYGWNKWVLGYDFQSQQRLLNGLYPGLASLRGMLWTLLVGGALLLAGSALVVLRRPAQPQRDEIRRGYARFRQRLARVGVAAAASEGPADFARRAARARPDLAADILSISDLYIQLRYGRAAGLDARALTARVRAFRPRPK